MHPLSILEEQLAHNTATNSPLNLIEAQLSQNSEQARRTELNKFLKDHNIKDGNLVQTRRLDLRSAQIVSKPANAVNSIKSNNPVEAFLAMQLNINSRSTERRFKCLNEASESSSDSDESDEDECQLTGIARYRQQKLAAMKKIGANS